MSILVTGGAGFIGSNFILEWFKQDHEKVINLDKLSYASCLENLKLLNEKHDYVFVQEDILNFDLVYHLLTSHQVRAIVHFAAESHVDRSISLPEIFIQNNVLGTLKLLEAARLYWSELPEDKKLEFRFLHVSTDEVYGSLKPNDPVFTENNQYQPNSPYAASKASSDHLVRAYGQTFGLPVIITNCSNNYGPHQHPEKFIPMCISNSLLLKPITIYGDGLQIRDWLYVADHCRALRIILDQGKVGERYNIGGENEKTNLEVVDLICSLLDKLCPRPDQLSYLGQVKFIKDRLGHDRRYAISSQKLFRDLNWTPIESFDSGLLKTVTWYLNHRHWTQIKQDEKLAELL
jgi:dTDP-glucose 4,6-dehydratase